ncbi:hypothetical protein GGF50DRAFT_121543 [Schizophyllum commune]
MNNYPHTFDGSSTLQFRHVTFGNSDDRAPADEDNDRSVFQPELLQRASRVDEYKKRENERKRIQGRKKRQQVKEELCSLQDQLVEAQQRIQDLEEQLRSAQLNQPPSPSLEQEQHGRSTGYLDKGACGLPTSF